MKKFTVAFFLNFVCLPIFLFSQKNNLIAEQAPPSVFGKKKVTTKGIEPLINIDAKPIALIPQSITLKKGLAFNLNVPKGYGISVAYEGLNRLRFLTTSPDGRLFATDATADRNDFDAQFGRFRCVHSLVDRTSRGGLRATPKSGADRSVDGPRQPSQARGRFRGVV